MSLTRYKQKRSFKDTPEPQGGKPAKERLAFVVQQHAASHLHYDFRLELKGVLKSWAVPKGPTMDPAVKRLAMLVEDHPYDYKDFEGIIPEGNYGAGTVIVWDEGWYEPAEDTKTKAEQEKLLASEFRKGQMKFELHGKKLKGRFALVHTKREGDEDRKQWLLIKDRDEYADTKDISLKNKSVVSGKTLSQIAKSKTAARWQSNREAKSGIHKRNTARTKKTSSGGKDEVDTAALLKKAKKAAMPAKISPMLCTLTKEVPDDPAYLYEVKWDGYRITAFTNAGKTKLHSRSGLDYSARYPNIVAALNETGHRMVLDGEVVVFNKKGLPDFEALQHYNGHTSDISYCLFDMLWMDGYDLKSLPLEVRKVLLRSIIGDSSILRYSESFDDGPALYRQMLKLHLEGIVAKKRNSHYAEGNRGPAWLKTPTSKRQEFVIGGWAESDKSRSFKTLVFGAYNKNGELEWIGRSGGGYKHAEMPSILKKLQALETKESPFVNKVLDTKGARLHWVKPKLVANFEFATWTKSGRIRKPATWLGFRDDKKAKEVVREIPG